MRRSQSPVWLIAVGLGVGFLGGCKARETGERLEGVVRCGVPVVRGQDGLVHACGPLTPDLLDAVKSEIGPTDTQLALTSYGGLSTDGIAFARWVAQRRLIIRVRHHCLSACSTYVLLAANRVVVEPDAIVAFHHGADFVVTLVADRLGLPSDDPYRDIGHQERGFFTEIGLDPDTGSKLTGAIQPNCVMIRNAAGGQTPAVVMASRYAWFIPTGKQSRQFYRGRIEGYWPTTRQEAEKLLRARIGRPSAAVRYGWPADLKSDPAEYARTLPPCAGSS